MAKDPEITLCSDCRFRPNDPNTRTKVAGGLRITTRQTEQGSAAVIYSVEDPRIVSQWGIQEGREPADAANLAWKCTPTPNGLAPGLGVSFDQRVALASEASKISCAIASILFDRFDLPNSLLFQQAETAGH